MILLDSDNSNVISLIPPGAQHIMNPVEQFILMISNQLGASIHSGSTSLAEIALALGWI